MERYRDVHIQCKQAVSLVEHFQNTVYVPLGHQILQMFEENYPEGLKRLFVIKGKCVLHLWMRETN